MFIFSDLLTRLFFGVDVFSVVTRRRWPPPKFTDWSDWRLNCVALLLSHTLSACLSVCCLIAPPAQTHIYSHFFRLVFCHHSQLKTTTTTTTTVIVISGGGWSPLAECVSIAPTETAAFCRTVSVRVSTLEEWWRVIPPRKKRSSVILCFWVSADAKPEICYLFSSYSQCLCVIFKKDICWRIIILLPRRLHFLWMFLQQ